MLVRRTVHIHPDGGLPVVTHAQIGIREAVPHRGDVAQPNRRPVRANQYDNILEIPLFVILAQGTNKYLLLARGYLAGGKVQRPLPNRKRDVLQRKPQRAQPALRYFYGNFIGAGAAGFGKGYFGKQRNPFFERNRQFLQGAFRRVAVNQQPDNSCSARDFPHFGTLRTRRKRCNAIHLCLDRVQRAIHVRTPLEFGNDGPKPFGSRGLDALDPFHQPDLLLYLANDGFFHFLRRSARIRHDRLNAIQGNVGQHLLRQISGGDQPGDQQKQHEHVRRNAVPGHPDDGAALLPGGTLVPVHGFAREAVRTTMPSVANEIPPTTTS